MCRRKMPIEALNLEEPVLSQLSRWMAPAHTIGQLEGTSVATLVAAQFEEQDAQNIMNQVHARLR